MKKLEPVAAMQASGPHLSELQNSGTTLLHFPNAKSNPIDRDWKVFILEPNKHDTCKSNH
jgi:hypothetical protein